MVAQSTCEVNYIAVVNEICEALWLAQVLIELNGEVVSVPLLRVANKCIVALIKKIQYCMDKVSIFN